MEIRDIFTDEVMHFGIGTLPPIIELLTVALAPFPGTGDITNWRIEPNVPIVAGRIRDLETKVGSRARDVPVA